MTPNEAIWMLGILSVVAYASYREGRRDERKQAKDWLMKLWEWLFKKEKKT